MIGRWLAPVALASVVGPAGCVLAQEADTTDPLQQAETAYIDVEFDDVLTHAAEALQAGGYDPPRLVRIYQLLGVSAASMGDADGARDFFQRMLAIDPDAELDDTVPPRLRAPYLEARGIVGARSDHLAIEVGLDRARASLHIALSDPFHMTRTVRAHGRLEGEVEFHSTEAPTAAEISAEVPGSADADRVEYWAEALDEWGNQLARVGTEFEPRTIGRPRAAVPEPVGVAPREPAEGGGRNLLEDPVFWVIALGVAAVAGGVAIGFVVEESSHVPVQSSVSFGVRY